MTVRPVRPIAKQLRCSAKSKRVIFSVLRSFPMMLGLLRSIELKTVKGLELDSPGDDMGQRSKGLAPHDVWPICGQNSQHITATAW